MRRTLVLLLLSFSTLTWGAKAPEGRWEGSVKIPGRELQLILDLAQSSAGGWIGSIIIPGLGIKGAPATNLRVTDSDLSFDVDGMLRVAPYGGATFKAMLVGADGLAGEMSQGGNVAKFSLRRVAQAQVELPTRSTAVAHDIEDQWIGDFELGGYPRHVTITLENKPDGAATAKFVVVGKQTTDLPVDLVVAEGNLLRIESQLYRVVFEGRFVNAAGEIRGVVEVGTNEAPLVLRRSARRPS
jgi:hypothetical protein